MAGGSTPLASAIHGFVAWFFRRRKKVYAFDFWITLTHTPEMRALARRFFREGHEIHIVSAISPGLPLDSDAEYERMLDGLRVPFTAIHRVDHVAAQKVAVLRKIKADCFWDDDTTYIDAAKKAGFKTCLVKPTESWGDEPNGGNSAGNAARGKP